MAAPEPTLDLMLGPVEGRATYEMAQWNPDRREFWELDCWVAHSCTPIAESRLLGVEILEAPANRKPGFATTPAAVPCYATKIPATLSLNTLSSERQPWAVLDVIFAWK